MGAMKRVPGSRIGLRLVLATAAAALLTGCSDATRFSADPFSNPFSNTQTASVDRNPTGTIAQKPRAASSTRIESQPLAPPPGATSQPAPVVTPAPAQQAALEPAPAPAQSSPRTVAAAHGSWSPEGGTPIVVAQGETVSMLSNRYGVPSEALLSANGLSSAGQVQPGARLVIPVYRNGAVSRVAAAPTAAPAPLARVEAKPAQGKETLKLVKGPEPAAKNSKTSTKTAKVEDDDDKPAAKGKASAKAEKSSGKVDKTADKSKDKKDSVKTAKNEPKADKKAKVVRADDDDDDIKPVKARSEPKAEAKAKPERKAEVQQPAQQRVAEAKPSKVDREPTASLPPKEEEKPAASAENGNPEFRWPARGRVIQGFKSGGNDGINIAVPEGTPVKAAEGGVVKYAGSELKGYGNLVLIQHPNGYVLAYAHNGELDVKRGDQVKRGQTIAKAGQTGNVTTPQVHFELRKGATPVDPTGYLAGL